MPKYKTHLAGGLIIFFILFFILKYLKINDSYVFLYFGASMLGSLFPDIDTKSVIQKILYFCLFSILVISLLINNLQLASLIGLLAILPIMVNHRKITHKIWFIILVPFSIPILIFHYNKNMIYPAFFSYLFFVGGGISHIWLDFGLKKAFKRFFIHKKIK